MKITINNATIVTSSGVYRKNILICDGKIERIENKTIKAKGVDFEIDGKELLVFPGFLDMHVHLREPGFEYKEDIFTGLTAAFRGGFTGVACMANTNPVNDNTTVTNFMKCKADACNLPVSLYPIAAITKGLAGESLVEMGELKEAGAVAFSDDGNPVVNSDILRKAMDYAETFNMPIICHSEDKSLSKNGIMNEGKISALLGVPGIPREAEILGIYRDLSIAKLTNARVHIAHVSTKEGVNLIRKAKKDGVRVTCETCPQYFMLTEEELLGFNVYGKVNPPLRCSDDIAAIKEALADGTIDVIASDHAPHHKDEKELELDKAAFGMIGLESMVPLCLELVREGLIDFKDLAEKLSRKPHKILGLKPPAINVGEEANLTIINPTEEWFFTEDNIASKSKNTPFIGRKLTGRAKYIIKKGEVFEIQT
ncbi:MAG: dihydroorotase [bacterium]